MVTDTHPSIPTCLRAFFHHFVRSLKTINDEKGTATFPGNLRRWNRKREGLIGAKNSFSFDTNYEFAALSKLSDVRTSHRHSAM